MSLQGILNASKKYSSPDEILGLITSVLSKNEAEIIDLNIDQLKHGLTSTGDKTKKYATKEYEDYKRSIGSISGEYADYILEGDFTDGINLKFESPNIIFDSSDSKTPKILNRDPFALGLTSDSFSKLMNDAMPEVKKQMINEFNK